MRYDSKVCHIRTGVPEEERKEMGKSNNRHQSSE